MKKSIHQPDLPQESRIFGVDFGLKKIGLAIADLENRIASAYETLENDGNFWEKFREITGREKIKLVIIGQAKYLSESSGKKTVRELAEKIRNELKIPVEFQEEMFSTLSARRNLKEAGAKNLSLDDAESARVILNDWLEKKK